MEQQSVLQELYDKIEEKGTSPEYDKIRRKSIEHRQIIEKYLTEEQKQELDILMEIKNEMAYQESKEYFIIGFTLATKLMIEVFHNKEDQ